MSTSVFNCGVTDVYITWYWSTTWCVVDLVPIYHLVCGGLGTDLPPGVWWTWYRSTTWCVVDLVPIYHLVCGGLGADLPHGVWWTWYRSTTWCVVDLVLVHNFCTLSVVPMDLDVKMKAVMLGACFLIVSVLSY